MCNGTGRHAVLLAKLAFAHGDMIALETKSDSDPHLHGIAFCTKSRSST